jgi:hypothetical protein
LSGKNDANDAAAIWRRAQPQLRFVTVKSCAAGAVGGASAAQGWQEGTHRGPQSLRGLLAEFGRSIPTARQPSLERARLADETLAGAAARGGAAARTFARNEAHLPTATARSPRMSATIRARSGRHA